MSNDITHLSLHVLLNTMPIGTVLRKTDTAYRAELAFQDTPLKKITYIKDGTSPEQALNYLRQNLINDGRILK